MADAAFGERIDTVRRFNRFYTRQIGLLQETLLESPFSLTEARILYEVASHERTTASQLSRALGIDPGYLSRVLRGLVRRRLVVGTPSPGDRRQRLLRLSPEGRRAFRRLETASRRQIAGLIRQVGAADQERLVRAMDAIESVLDPKPEPRVPYLLRQPRPGDMGWVVHRHGVLYNLEYNWDERFEALVAEIVATFLQRFDRQRERCWIAERDGENVGSVFLVKHPEREGVAKLRLLLVEPQVRGLGIGRRLVQECTRFARQSGYRTITLWTNSILHAARRIYELEGYRLVKEDAHHSFGHDLVGQHWELAL